MSSLRRNPNYHSPKLISYGDTIKKGIYHIHSRFRRTINLQNGNILLSIVNQDIGKGPFNIILHYLDFREIHSLIVLQNVIIINKIPFQLHEDLKYHSKITFQNAKVDKLYENLNFVESFLANQSPDKSLSFLFNEKRETYFATTFERAFLQRIKQGIEYMQKGTLENLKKGIAWIKGCGFGLTPSGDDFLAGLLSGLYVKHEIKGNDLSEVRKLIYTYAQGENLISNSFLTSAYKGLFNEGFKNFIMSLFQKNHEQLISHVESFLDVGATSGADTLVGFMFAWKKAGELWL